MIGSLGIPRSSSDSDLASSGKKTPGGGAEKKTTKRAPKKVASSNNLKALSNQLDLDTQSSEQGLVQQSLNPSRSCSNLNIFGAASVAVTAPNSVPASSLPTGVAVNYTNPNGQAYTNYIPIAPTGNVSFSLFCKSHLSSCMLNSFHFSFFFFCLF